VYLTLSGSIYHLLSGIFKVGISEELELGGAARYNIKNGEYEGLLNMRKITVGLIPALIIFLTLIGGAWDQQVKPKDSRGEFPPDFMGIAGVHGWILAGTPRTFPKEGLPGYVGGGAEIFLQYGFRNLTLFQLVPERGAAPKKSITLEIYRMESPAAAFGIFSTRREGDEPVSPGIKTAHWVEPEKANLVKGNLFVNIVASGCTKAEVEDFAMSLVRQLPAADARRPEAFSCMPEFNLVPGSERYICGEVAAAKESPLLGAAFWGFKEGLAEAYSARYGPGKSKLVLIKFKQPPEDIFDDVLGLFQKSLTDVTMINRINRIMQGRTVFGRRIYFGVKGLHAVIILDEPDQVAASARIDNALDRAAHLRDVESKKSVDEKKK